VTQLQANQFSHGILNPGLGYVIACLGSFLGLRCLTRSRVCTGRTRVTWLLIASVALGGTGIWVTHIVAMLGYTIPGQEILYNVPMTALSLAIAISVVATGLFIVGLGRGGLGLVLVAGMIMGTGIAAMHYVGMAAVSMHGTMRYDLRMVGISVLSAMVICAAVLAAGLRVRGVWSSLGVSVVMGAALTGMHYTAMAAVHVYAGGPRMVMSGEPASSLLFPLLLGGSVVTFLLMLIIAISPNEDEIVADASLTQRLRAGASLAVRDTSRAWQGEVKQPDVFAQPGVIEPGVIEPGVIEPGVIEPGVIEAGR
jgi:NO-binding membrane sensor protein with MHYT domain